MAIVTAIGAGLALALLVLWPDPPTDVRGERPNPRFECELHNYPCTWGEVADAVVDRTRAVGEIAGLYGLSGASLDDIADFLEGQPDVVSVEILGTGVRYRLAGGGPAWVYPDDELAHHRAPRAAADGRSEGSPRIRVDAAGDRSPDGDPPTSASPGAELRRGLAAVGARLAQLGIQPLLAEGTRGVAAETPGEGKQALILSPFEFEFPGAGEGFAMRARVIRDYREMAGGSVTFHADLHEYEDDPAGPGEVTFEDFLHWDRYNLIVLASHGTTRNCLVRPVGGRRVSYREGEVPARMEYACPLIWVGRHRMEDFEDYLGVELVPFTRHEFEVHPGLTRSEAESCAEQERAFFLGTAGIRSADPRFQTPGGKPCWVELGDRTLQRIALWTPFFWSEYPDGLEHTIVFLAACWGEGVQEPVIDTRVHVLIALALFGFDSAVSGADAFDVGNHMLDLLGKGYDSRELLERMQQMDRTNHLVGRALHPGDDEELTATPAAIAESSSSPTHGRDIVLLVDPLTGDELQDGAVVRVRTVATGAGPESRLAIHPQIIGVLEGEPPLPLRVRVVGEPVPDETYLPEHQVEEGAYRFANTVTLGRDHTDGEIVDLEVFVDLGGGRQGRWVYRNIRLRGTWWEVTVTGGPVALPVLSGRRVGSQLHVILGMADRAGAEPDLSPLPPLTIALQAGRAFVEGPNTGLVTMHFRARGYTCAGFSGGGFQLTLASVKPLDGEFEGRVTCTPGKLDDPSRFAENLRQRFEAHATGRFRAR